MVTQRVPERRLEMLATVLVAAGALCLAGCGIGPFGAPPSVSTILQKAATVQIASEDYTEAFTGRMGGANTKYTYEVKQTTNPNRMDITFSIDGPEGLVAGEAIHDAATNTSYEKLAQSPAGATGKWFETDKFDALQTSADIGPLMDFKDDTDAAVVGADSVGGQSVWHLTRHNSGDTVGNATEDLFFAQSDFKPVKIVVTTSGADAGTLTIIFKAINDPSISISLPPTD